MKETLNKVKEFQEAFLSPVEEKPFLLSEERGVLRYNLMKEENEEYLLGIKNKDLVEIADALGDQLYILCGTILEHGMQDIIEKVFQEIHRSNMSKLGENGKPIYREDGKIMKGPNYFKPNLLPILLSNKKT